MHLKMELLQYLHRRRCQSRLLQKPFQLILTKFHEQLKVKAILMSYDVI